MVWLAHQHSLIISSIKNLNVPLECIFPGKQEVVGELEMTLWLAGKCSWGRVLGTSIYALVSFVDFQMITLIQSESCLDSFCGQLISNVILAKASELIYCLRMCFLLSTQYCESLNTQCILHAYLKQLQVGEVKPIPGNKFCV